MVPRRDTAAWTTSPHTLHEQTTCDDPEDQLSPCNSEIEDEYINRGVGVMRD